MNTPSEVKWLYTSENGVNEVAEDAMHQSGEI